MLNNGHSAWARCIICQEGEEEAETDADRDAYSYSMAREYNWTIKSRPSERGERSQDILMLMKPHVVTYALLETKYFN